MTEVAFWLPLALMFGSALLAAIVKRYTKDPCLKVFQRAFVFIKLKDGRWLSGDLKVYSNCLEVLFRDGASLGGGRFEKLTHVLYEHNLDLIDRILRPSPLENTRERKDWECEIYRLQHPSFARRVRRKLRNIFNMLRDAFAQSVTLVFGAVRRRTRLSTVPVDEGKVGEMGRTLISAVPNAYEPILERYLGRLVVVETVLPDRFQEQVGALQEYSAKFLLVRDADLLADLPPDLKSQPLFNGKFDVIVPRQMNFVRHLARSNSTNRPSLESVAS